MAYPHFRLDSFLDRACTQKCVLLVSALGPVAMCGWGSFPAKVLFITRISVRILMAACAADVEQQLLTACLEVRDGHLRRTTSECALRKTAL